MRNEANVPVVLLGDLTLLRPLAMAKIPAIVAVTDPEDPTLRSRHAKTTYLLPSFGTGGADDCLERLLPLAEALRARHGKRPPLVYGSDESLAFIYKHRERIQEHFALVLSEPEVAEALLYKHTFAQLATARGVRVPRTIHDPRQLEAVRGALIAKPRSKVEVAPLMRDFLGPCAKARVFENASEVFDHPAYAAIARDLIVQELIPGGEESLFSFHGFADEQGDLLASFCGRKIRAFPSPAGESSCIELVVDEELAQHGREVAARLELRGPFKIDLIRDPRTGTFYTLEVNARYTLWHHLAAVEGINVPATAYHYLVHGERRAPHAYRPKHRWVDLYRDYKAFEEQRRRGQLDAGGWLSSLAAKRTVHEAFAWDDPAPALVWLQGELGRAMKNRLTRLRPSREA